MNMGIFNKRILSLSIILTLLIIFLASCAPYVHTDPLTQEERKWLDENIEKIVFQPELNFPPFSYVDENGDIDGISIDYFSLIEDRLGVEFIERDPAPLNVILQNVQVGDVDIISSLKKTADRSEYLYFTEPYLNIPAVIIVQDKYQGNLSLFMMGGMSVGVGEGYAVEEYLKKFFPSINLITYSDDLEGLRKVSFGELDAVVMDIASASYFINNEGITNLRVGGDTGYVYDLSFASRKDIPILNSILEKGLSQISAEEREALQDEYILLKQESIFSQEEFWITMVVVLGVFFAGIGWFIFWNKILRTKVAEKTGELKAELTAREKVEKALRNSEERYHAMVDDQVEMVTIISPREELTFVNKAYCQFTGLSKKELIGKRYDWLIFEDDKKMIADVLSVISVENPISRGQNRVIGANGKIRWTSWINRGIFNDEGQIVEYQSVGLDITESKLAEEQLKQSEERYRSIFNSAGVALIEIDISKFLEKINDYKSGKMTYSTALLDIQPESFEELLECVRIQNVNKNALDLFEMGDKEDLLELIHSLNLSDVKRFYRDIYHELWSGSTFISAETKSKTLKGKELFLYIVITILKEHPGRSLISITNITNIKQRELEMQQLAQVGIELRMTDLDSSWYPKVLSVVNELLDSPDVAMVLKDENTNKFKIEAGIGNPISCTGNEISDKSIVGKVIETGDIYISEDIYGDENFTKPDLVGNNKAVVIVPLVAERQNFGALVAGREVPFNDNEVNLITTLAEMAASNIYRGMLDKQIQNRLRHMQALRNVEHAINTITDKQIIIDLYLNQVTSLLNINAAIVLELNHKINQLEFISSIGLEYSESSSRVISLLDNFVGKAILNRNSILLNNIKEGDLPPFLKIIVDAEKFNAILAVPLISKGRIRGILILMNKGAIQFSPELNELLETFSNQAGLALENISIYEDMQYSNTRVIAAIEDVIQSWSKAVEKGKECAEGHIESVVRLSKKIARAMGLDEDAINSIRQGSYLHDIGESLVPDSIMHKRGSLGQDEYGIVRKHPENAVELLSGIDYLSGALEIPMSHHERWDGSGYPKGLKGQGIPLAARIFSIVDVWDMLGRDRPYRDAWPEQKIRSYFDEQSGKLFDPQVIAILFDVIKDMD